MWSFIKYCFYCIKIVILASFGYNPIELTWKTGVTGIISFFVLIGLVFLIAYIIYFILNKKDNKKNNIENK